MTAETLSSRMQNLTFSLEHVAVLIRSRINGDWNLRSNLRVPKCFVNVPRPIVALTTSQISVNLAAKDKKNGF